MRLSHLGASTVAASLLLTSAASAITIVIDFNDVGQPNTTDIFGNSVSDFSVTSYGFTQGDYGTVTNAILGELRNDYYGIPTQATLAGSPIPAGFELDIDFEIGDFGTAPTNGDTEYYTAQLGTGVSGPHVAGTFGVAGGSTIRTSSGQANPFGLNNGDVVVSVFTDNIQGLGGVGNALSSGNLSATMHAINGTLAHEIGHALSLAHIQKSGAITPNGGAPIMGISSLGITGNDRINDREFALSGFGANGNPQFHIQQLVSAVGLRAIPEPSSLTMLLIGGIGMLRRRRRA